VKTAYRPPKINTGDLRIPVVFFEYEPATGPEPGETEKQELHRCYALIYNPSMKDREILKVNETKEGLTLKIRDAKEEFVPTNKCFVEVLDYRYQNRIWNVIDVSYDFEDNRFIKLVLGEPNEK